MFTNKGLKYYASEPDDYEEKDEYPSSEEHIKKVWDEYDEMKSEYDDGQWND